MGLWHTNIVHQYLSGRLLNSIMHFFFFPDLKPPIISILYGYSGIYGHFDLCSVLFYYNHQI